MAVWQTKSEPLPPAASEPSANTTRAIRAVLWLLAGAIVAGWLGLAARHLRDDYRVSHTQGVWMAAAEAARAGRWYPPVFDGEHYAGTRYLPLAILVNAASSTVVGDPLVGGKLAAAILMAALLSLVVVGLRACHCPWPVAVALAAVVVATDTGLRAGTTIGGDLLPAVLQLGALAMVLRGRAETGLVVGGALAGLAIASKLTGVWAFLAIAVWLVAERRWRHLRTFVIAAAITAGLVLGVFEWMTDGRLSQHVLAFSTAGVHGALSLLRSPNQVLYNLRGFAVGTLVLVPAAVLGVLLSSGWRQLSVIHVAWGISLALLLVVYGDVGTGYNQLLDFIALTSMAVGHLAGRASAQGLGRGSAVVVLFISIAAAWAASVDLVRTVAFDLRGSLAAPPRTEQNARLVTVVAGMVQPHEDVLAEDPAVYLALERQPIVMDPFMVTRLERTDPRQVDPLVSWIGSRRFDLVVLIVPLEDRSQDFWWNDFHFGPRVAEALRASYRFDRKVGRFFLYRPRA